MVTTVCSVFFFASLNDQAFIHEYILKNQHWKPSGPSYELILIIQLQLSFVTKLLELLSQSDCHAPSWSMFIENTTVHLAKMPAIS